MLASRPGKAFGREELGELLWPGDDPKLQGRRLREELSNIRVRLSSEVISKGKHTFVFADPAWLTSDVAEFDAAILAAERAPTPLQRIAPLVAAIEIYRGDLLPGAFDDWVISEREWLRDGLFGAYSRLLQDLESLGRTDEARRYRALASSQFPERDLPSVGIVSPASVPTQVAVGRYFGRQAERDSIAAWLDSPDGRLLTLLGPGGIGKSRLAQEATVGRVATFVFLADVADANRFYETIREALPQSSPKRDPYDAVVAGLRSDERPVLVLDNLEQIADRVGARLEPLLRDVPRLKVIVTSRRRLSLPLECVLPVNPLPDDLSVALFLDRAQSVRPDFGRGGDAAGLVTELVRLLEGLPLALELAAARSVVLGPRQILAQLQQRLSFLVNQKLPQGERHRSIRTVVDWSHDLLSPDFQRAFRRFSLFRRGFSLGAAQALFDSALDAVEALHAHSLLQVTFDADGEARYDFHALVRDYAEQQLAESPELEDAAGCFVGYFAAEAERLVGEANLSARRRWLEREIENFRQAIRLAAERQDGANLFALLDRLGAVFFDFGYWRDFDTLLVYAESHPLVSREHRRLCSLRGAFAQARGDEETARKYWSIWRERSHAAGAPEEERTALIHLAFQALERNDPASLAHIRDYRSLETLPVHQDHLRLLEAWASRNSGDDDRAIQELRALLPRLISTEDIPFGLILYVTRLLSELKQHRDVLAVAPTFLRALVEAGIDMFQGVFAGQLGDAYAAMDDPNRAAELYFISFSVLSELDSRHREAARRKWEAAAKETCPKWGKSPPPWRDMLEAFLSEGERDEGG